MGLEKEGDGNYRRRYKQLSGGRALTSEISSEEYAPFVTADDQLSNWDFESVFKLQQNMWRVLLILIDRPETVISCVSSTVSHKIKSNITKYFDKVQLWFAGFFSLYVVEAITQEFCLPKFEENVPLFVCFGLHLFAVVNGCYIPSLPTSKHNALFSFVTWPSIVFADT